MRVQLTVLLLAVVSCVGAAPVPCTDCSGKCVDTNTDSKNCGMCGNACASGNLCSDGRCVAACGAGQLACPSGCADTMTDRRNCGMCSRACAMGQVCSGGNCSASCGTGYSTCNVLGEDICVDLTNDSRNCGSCGMACGAGQVCQNMQCTVSCPAGRTMCNPGGVPPYCTDTNTDNANCGACAQPCGQGLSCNAGVCDRVCTAPLLSCAADAGATPHYCADPRNDAKNCGACGQACPPNFVCTGGNCRTVFARNCVELQASLGGAGVDGPARLYLQNKPWFPFQALCADMDGGATIGTVAGTRVQTPLPDGGHTDYFDAGRLIFYTDSGIILPGTESGPKTYIALPNQGPGQNVSVYDNTGFGGIAPNNLVNKWAGVRFDPNTFQVSVQDYRFVTTTGIGGNMTNSNLHYGMAAACQGAVEATSNIDLRHTPFFVDSANGWAVNFSFAGHGSRQLSAFNQVVTVNGGGSCGGFDLFTNPFGSYKLQLRWQPITCATIKRDTPSSATGVYSLVDGSPFDAGMGEPLAFCDMTTSGGGWTLVMKIDGTKADSRFYFDDPLWTNGETYNAGVPDLSRTEAKYQPFMGMATSEMMLQSVEGTTTRTLLLAYPGFASLDQMFTTGTFVPVPLAGPVGWTNLFGGGTLEPTICQEGFNVRSPVTKVRIGIITNNEGDCSSPDSEAGLGGFTPLGNCRPGIRGYSAGAYGGVGCGPPVGNIDKGLFTYVYVR